MVCGKASVSTAVLVAALAGCGSRPGPGLAVSHHLQTARSRAPGPLTGLRGSMPSPPRGHASGGDDEQRAETPQASTAGPVARSFFVSYLAYLYGRRRASRVAGADQSVRAELEHGRAMLTPAERASRPRIAHMSIRSAGPPISVVAVAVVEARQGASSRLTATLEPRRGRWVVVAIAG